MLQGINESGYLECRMLKLMFKELSKCRERCRCTLSYSTKSATLLDAGRDPAARGSPAL